MANSKAISIRIPDELLEKIDLLAEEKYKSHKGTPNRSLVVLDAIVAYFDTLSDTSKIDDAISVSDSVSIADFNELRDIVSTLSDSIIRLESNSITPSDSVKKMDRKDKLSKKGQLIASTVPDGFVSLNGKELSERLKISESKLQRWKTKNELSEWSKAEDPELIAWSYDPETKKFSPIKPLA
jgi:predicted DNA-binding protein